MNATKMMKGTSSEQNQGRIHLLFFTDRSQLEDVKSSYPAFFREMRPITNDMAVAFELERLGVEYIDEWDFLKSEDIESNKDIAHNLAKNWWDEHLESTEYEGFALTDAVQQDIIYPFETCLNARTVYGRLFEAYSVGKISGYFLPSVAIVRNGPFPAFRAVQSVSQAVLFYMANQRGIHVDQLSSKLALSSTQRV